MLTNDMSFKKMIMIPADDAALRKELTTPGNVSGLVRSARKRNDLLFDKSIPDSQKLRLLANEDQSYDALNASVKNTVPLIRTVKDKKREGKEQWMKKLMEEQNELLRAAIKGSVPYSTATPFRPMKEEESDESAGSEEEEEEEGSANATPVKKLINAGKRLIDKSLKSAEKTRDAVARSRDLRERFKKWQRYPDGRLGSHTPEK